MLAIACDAAAAEEAEGGQLPGNSSEAEVSGGAAPISAAAQASNDSKNGRWVKQSPNPEILPALLSQPVTCRALWLCRQSLLHALRSERLQSLSFQA